MQAYVASFALRSLQISSVISTRNMVAKAVTMQVEESQKVETKIKEVAEDLLKRMGIALVKAKKQGDDKVVEYFETEET